MHPQLSFDSHASPPQLLLPPAACCKAIVGPRLASLRPWVERISPSVQVHGYESSAPPPAVPGMVPGRPTPSRPRALKPRLRYNKPRY